MLSLGSNISATQSVEAKYSAVFDGTDDFVDCGLIDFNTNDFSVSCWIKVREWTQYSVIWGNRSDSSNENIGVSLRTTGVTGELQLFSDWGTPTDSSIVTGVPADTWIHVVCTGDRDGDQVIYLNHDDATTTTDISDRSSVDFTSDLEFRIGRSHSNHYHNMSISQLGVWNVALSANAVEALYNNGKPINLRINQGNYASSSNLQQYYKFGDGSFDDKAKGIVHDQDNPGFGSNLLAGNNSTFDGANDWTAYNAPSGTTTLSTTGGVLQVTLSGAGNGVDSGARLNTSTLYGVAVGKVYKVKAEIWLGTSTTTTGWRIFMGGVTVSLADAGGSISSNRTTFTTYIKPTTTGQLTIFNTDTDSDTGTFFIDNVSVKELNGNPGVTSGGVTFSSDTP